MMSKTDKFIEKAKKIHGDKYDYSKVNYINSRTKICIVCPEHGEFWQTPENHTAKKHPQGCPICSKINSSKKRKLTTEQFIEKARKIHGNKYDYSKVKYINNHTEVCIICPEHGEFWQTPQGHLSGRGCNLCRYKAISKKLSNNNDDFIERARKVHGDKYDYSKVNYVNNRTKVCIICPEHGEFWQTPDSHLSGSGCKICKKEKLSSIKKIPYNDILKKMNETHNNKYHYCDDTYVDTRTKMKIICPEHGEFWQTPKTHIKGAGCPICAGNKKLTLDEFIKRSIKKHGIKYDYSKSIYEGYEKNILIICPEHGEFWQKAGSHMNGANCPSCLNKSKLEEEVANKLKSVKIRYIKQCDKNTLFWLQLLKMDFFLQDFKICIECQGIQHFKPIAHFGDTNGFNKCLERDIRKKKLCNDHGIKIYYFSHENYDDFLGEKVYHNFDELLNKIKNEKRLL